VAVVMAAMVIALRVVRALLAPVLAMLPLLMAVTNPQRPMAPMQMPPLSAYVRPRPPQPRTAKENKHAATCSPQVP